MQLRNALIAMGRPSSRHISRRLMSNQMKPARWFCITPLNSPLIWRTWFRPRSTAGSPMKIGFFVKLLMILSCLEKMLSKVEL